MLHHHFLSSIVIRSHGIPRTTPSAPVAAPLANRHRRSRSHPVRRPRKAHDHNDNKNTLRLRTSNSLHSSLSRIHTPSPRPPLAFVPRNHSTAPV